MNVVILRINKIIAFVPKKYYIYNHGLQGNEDLSDVELILMGDRLGAYVAACEWWFRNQSCLSTRQCSRIYSLPYKI